MSHVTLVALSVRIGYTLVKSGMLEHTTENGGSVQWQLIFGCHVDLLTYYALEKEASPRFRENVMRDMKVIYERAS